MTCGLNIQHLINVLLKDYLVSFGFSMTRHEFNEERYLYQTLQSQLQVEGKLYIVEIEYFGEDIGMHRNVDFIL